MVGKLITLSETESTNKYAMELIAQNLAESGMGIYALHQTAGKGQRGKKWESAAGQNITLSLIYKPHGLNIEQQPIFNLLVATIVFEFINIFAQEELTIKWPNDIFWRDNKAAGILTENRLSGSEWKWSVIGIGINVNQTQFGLDAAKPVSLKQITKTHFDLPQLVQQLHRYFFERLEALNQIDEKKILAAYNNHLYKKNVDVSFLKAAQFMQARVLHVNAAGQLATDKGLFNFGDLIWQIK